MISDLLSETGKKEKNFDREDEALISQHHNPRLSVVEAKIVFRMSAHFVSFDLLPFRPSSKAIEGGAPKEELGMGVGRGLCQVLDNKFFPAKSEEEKDGASLPPPGAWGTDPGKRSCFSPSSFLQDWGDSPSRAT